MAAIERILEFLKFGQQKRGQESKFSHNNVGRNKFGREARKPRKIKKKYLVILAFHA